MKEESTKTKSGVSRREFITGALGSAAVVGAVSTLMPGVAAAAPSETRSTVLPTSGKSQPVVSVTKDQATTLTNWAYKADVVVVGYGSAGAVAAMTAFDAGANTLILEKTPSLASLGVVNNNTDETAISGGGGNSHICGGGGWYVLDPVAFAQWHYKMSFGATPMETCMAFANMVAQNRAWYDANGVPYTNPGTTVAATGEYQAFGSIGGQVSLSQPDSGMSLFYALDQLVTQTRGIPVLFNTRGTALIQDPTTREVLGVQALQNQSEIVNIQAKRAVVLTTGGFEFDATMKLNYCKMAPYHFGGWQYNTGDGIKMAQAAGAGLWHMNTTSGRLSPWTPNYNTAWAQHHANNAYIWTDRYGNRFTDEIQTTGLPSQGIPSHSTWQAVVDWNFQYGEYSRVPTLLIFDSTTFNNGPAVGAELPQTVDAGPSGSGDNADSYGTGSGTGYVKPLGSGTPAISYLNGYGTGIFVVPAQLGGTGALGGFTGSAVGTAWSKDNKAELAAGYLVSGPDITTLAANIAAWTIVGSNQGMAVPPGWNSAESMDNVTLPGGTSCPHFSAANLMNTINQWNKDCAAGNGDSVFGRTAASMAPIQTPPYYALPIWPSGPNTNGGPIRNAKGQTCDPYYNPIPRLYHAGELGSVWGFLYQGGGNITESVAYGRITGNNAASEVPWTT